MDAVMSHYTFREQVFKNLKLNESLDCSTQAKVKNFLRHIEEPAEVIIMDSVLSIVPNSQKSLFESQSHLISNFSPRVALERDDIEKLREKVRQDFLEAKEKIVDDFSGGIFGDDDYYSLQLSQAQSTSISTAPTLKRKATSITDSSNEVIPIKKFVSKVKLRIILDFPLILFAFQKSKKKTTMNEYKRKKKTQRKPLPKIKILFRKPTNLQSVAAAAVEEPMSILPD